MNSKISLLGITVLLGASALAHASWNKYTGGQGQGDCREMRCQYGCVEDEEYNGKCCPAGQYGDKCWGGQCCQSDFVCSSDSGEGTCGCPKATPVWNATKKTCVECIKNKDCKDGLICNTKTNTCGCEKNEDCEGELVCLPEKICGCSTGTSLYTKLDGTSGCCSNTTHVLAEITGDTAHKVCCPKATPVWDNDEQKCVECITDTDCKGEATCSPDKTCKGSDCTFKNKTYHHEDIVPNANGCGQCNNGTIEPKKADCKECNTTTWTWKNVPNSSKRDEEDKCCIGGKRQNHATLCPAPCYDGETKYNSNDAIGQCGKCQNGKMIKDTNKLDDCHDCNTEWQIVEKESAQDRICGTQCCAEDMGCVDGKCSFVTKKCIPLYTNKKYTKEVKKSPCCGQLTPKGDSGILFKGYYEGDAEEYGCCPNEKTYMDSYGNKRCCSGVFKNDQCVDPCIGGCKVGKKCILLSDGTYDLATATHRESHGYCGWIKMTVTPPGEKTQDITAYGATNPKGGHVYDSGNKATFDLPKDTIIEVKAQIAGTKYCSYSCSIKRH